jgi:iron complex outermembrane recepter protein
LGVGFTSDHVNVDLSLFQNTIQNFIYINKLSSVNGGDSIPDPDDPVPAYRFTQGNVILAGGEFSMDIHPHPLDWLHFENSVGYVYAQRLNAPDDAKFLPFIPPAKIRSELRSELPKISKPLQNFFAEVNFEYRFAQKFVLRENNFETPTPGYPLLGASLGFDIYAKGKTKVLSFVIAAQNILNKTYQDHLSRLKYAPVNPATGHQGIWNMGRNFSVKLIFPLEFKL